MDINVFFLAVSINPTICVAIVAIFMLSMSALLRAVRASKSAHWNLVGVAVVAMSFLMQSLLQYSALDFNSAWLAALLALGVLGVGYGYCGHRNLQPPAVD